MNGVSMKDYHDNSIISIFEDTLGSVVQKGNSITVLKNGNEIFPVMLEAVTQARESIEFLTFVYWSGNIASRFAEALSQKAQEGVKVRAILDSFGAKPMPRQLVNKMLEAGVEIAWFRPLMRFKLWESNHRTHRKILICDRKVAFTGGVGIADEWEGDANGPSQWRDTHFKIMGPAVSAIFSGFVENWQECGRKISDLIDVNRANPKTSYGESAVQVLRSPAAYGWSDFTTLIRLIISIAKSRINITTAYFNPDKATSELLIEAVRRGVKVNILVPGQHTDKKIAKIAGEAKYGPLLEAGVRVFHYQRTMLHAKVITIDKTLACVGSPNFNQRSMRKDDELGLTIFDSEVVIKLDSHFESDIQSAIKVDPIRWADRGFGKRFLEYLVTRVEGEI
jgi:cardiolipin synthase